MNLYENGGFTQEEETQPTEFTYEEFLKYKKSCEEQIELGERAVRMSQNPDFVALVMEDYFVKEPHRLADLMASGRITGKAFDGCVEDLKAIAHLRNFLKVYIDKANLARNELASLQEAYDAAVTSGGLNPNDLI
jgi:hypothetical protein